MERRRKLIVAKVGVVMGTVPFLIWALPNGPDVGSTGAPGEQTCSQTRCHVGTAASPQGSVRVTFPGGTTYSPGVKQHLIVSITNPTARVWGFQLTARQANATGTMAGTFASTDRTTSVLCMAAPNASNPTYLDLPASQNCPSNTPFTYIEHALPKQLSQTFEFDWTPPATSVGNIQIYVAANAANNNGKEDGDQIYSTSYTLTPAAAPAKPTITAVQNGASFVDGVVPNSWITIKGTNLATTTNTWDKAIVDNKLPTELEGVSVSVGGKPAYIYFVSPEQVNALAPDVGAGSVGVTVTNAGGTSTPATANSATLMPAFFGWPGGQAVATRTDYTWAVKNGTFPGTTTAAAKPGETIVLWGTGFGPTNPAAPVGSVSLLTVQYNVASSVSVTVGGSPAPLLATPALTNGLVGVYQVAIKIPDNAPNGDLPIVATVGGAQSPTGMTITVQR